MNKKQEKQNSYWPPNWRDENQYPDLAGTTLLQWGWEFVRRNKEYNAGWKKALSCFLEERDNPAKRQLPENWSQNGYWDREIDQDNFIIYPYLGAKYPDPWQKWHLPVYFNPETNRPHFIINTIVNIQPRIYAGKYHPLKVHLPDSANFTQPEAEFLDRDLAFSIDIHDHIEPQLKTIKSLILQLQKAHRITVAKKNKGRPTKWGAYLRVLDAAELSSKKEAAPIIFADRVNILEAWDEHLKQANMMLKSGFKKLLVY